MNKRQVTAEGGFTMLFLRVWLCVVPIAMLGVAGVFGVIAAVDGRWGLVAVMLVLGLFAIGLMVLHLWALYGFGRNAGAGR